MKVQGLISLLSLSSVVAWRVDKRCLQEGQILTGEDVEMMLESEAIQEEFEFNDYSFDWDQFPLLVDLDIEGPTSLRGSSVLLQNETSSRFSNSSRSLQSGREFNLKLYWRQGACWQDEWIERKWCMQCSDSCSSGEVVRIKTCKKKWTQRFKWDDGRIKVASKNTCLTKSGNKKLSLRSCGGSNQKFRGYRSEGGFQIKPAGSSKCLSQHHHPKSGEVIELTDCNLAASHNTDKFNVYWPSGGGDGSKM